jgi:hypothetical protein
VAVQVECYSEADWNGLAERFEGCESRLERSLLQTLREDFLPEIPRLFQEKEKVCFVTRLYKELFFIECCNSAALKMFSFSKVIAGLHFISCAILLSSIVILIYIKQF